MAPQSFHRAPDELISYLDGVRSDSLISRILDRALTRMCPASLYIIGQHYFLEQSRYREGIAFIYIAALGGFPDARSWLEDALQIPFCEIVHLDSSIIIESTLNVFGFLYRGRPA